MIVPMNVSHFVKICQVLLTLVHQLICRGVANFGTRCIQFHIFMQKNCRFKHTCNNDTGIGRRKQQKLVYCVSHIHM